MLETVGKYAQGREAGRNINGVLATLAVFSAGYLLVGALACLALPTWPVRMHTAICFMLFDLVFVVEFLARATGLLPGDEDDGRPALPQLILLFCSSVLPFALVSGPFMFGWAFADLASPPVRGYETAFGVAAALGAAGSLRLLRLLRPFASAPRASGGARTRALLIGLSIALGGALLVYALILPGYRKTLSAERVGIARGIVGMDSSAVRALAESAPDLSAARSSGLTVFSKLRQVDAARGDFEFHRYGDVEAWFSAIKNHEARYAWEAALACLACVGACTLAIAKLTSDRKNARAALPNLDRSSAKGKPVGREELEGILGKAT